MDWTRMKPLHHATKLRARANSSGTAASSISSCSSIDSIGGFNNVRSSDDGRRKRPAIVSPRSRPTVTPSSAPSPASTSGYDPKSKSPLTEAAYIREHANAPPSSLRHILQTKIFAHDDVEYLSRLVKDVGGMDYVFRFLWYDGSTTTSTARSVRSGGIFGSGTRRVSFAEPQQSKDGSRGRSTGSSIPFSVGGPCIHGPSASSNRKSKKSKLGGRTWIQYCCYWNAHKCLQWIFNEIARLYRCRKLEARRHQKSLEGNSNSDSVLGTAFSFSASLPQSQFLSRSLTTPVSIIKEVPEDDDEDEDDQTTKKVIRELLEIPDPQYCGTNYLAVAAMRDSDQCLSLLLHYGIDPNMHVNSHRSTAAHLAAWNNHVNCLRVLGSGHHDCDTGQSDHGSLSGEDENDQNKYSIRRKVSYDLTSQATTIAATLSRNIRWTTDWNLTNSLGETPVHVAAREGCFESMQFFLDLIVSNVSTQKDMEKGSSSVMEESYQSFISYRSDASYQSIDSNNSTIMSSNYHSQMAICDIDFSIRNHEGMDCTALAAMSNQAAIISLLSHCIGKLATFKDADAELSQHSDPQKRSNHIQIEGKFQHSKSFHLPQYVNYANSQWQPQWHSQPPQSQPTQLQFLQSQRRTVKSMPAIYPFQTATERPNTSSISTNQSEPCFSPNFHQNQYKQQQNPCFPSLNLRNPLERRNHEAPIHVAARIGNRLALEALFASPYCDVGARDSFGMTALHVAALERRLNVCRFFAGLESDKFELFDVVDVLGRTPLYIACSLGLSEIARILTPVSNWRILCQERKKPADSLLYVNVAHQPPLHAAVVNDHVNTVSVLLDCGVDVDMGDAEGRTAISAAAKLGYYEMCQMLILHGANVNTRSVRGGPTPFQKAKKYKHQQVADLLHEFGGK